MLCEWNELNPLWLRYLGILIAEKSKDFHYN